MQPIHRKKSTLEMCDIIHVDAFAMFQHKDWASFVMSIIYHLHFSFHIASMLLPLGLVWKRTRTVAAQMYLCAIKCC